MTRRISILAVGVLALSLGCGNEASTGVDESALAAASSGAACKVASDCTGILPMYCKVCPDGTTACAHFDCVGGQCVVATCEPKPPPPSCCPAPYIDINGACCPSCVKVGCMAACRPMPSTCPPPSPCADGFVQNGNACCPACTLSNPPCMAPCYIIK